MDTLLAPRIMQHFVELLGLTALAMIAAATALVHGDVFFAVFFGAATGAAWTVLIRHCLNLDLSEPPRS